MITTEELYALLPAIHRIRDTEQGGPLKALVGVIAAEASAMEADIAQLYENWFAETCAEWTVPYVGDLLGVRGLHPIEGAASFSQRGRVANTLGYRRRKGTATMLEQLARDATGWEARAVEFFELLEWTQNVNHTRPQSYRTPDLRDTNQLELLNTAFDRIAHTPDVRHISNDRGRHNIPNVGLFLWRLESYFTLESAARAVTTPGDGRYTFSPFGTDGPLFNRPQTESSITHLAEEINVPGRLRRRPLYDELEARRQALVDGRTPAASYFGEAPVVQVAVQSVTGGLFVPVPPEEIAICNLGEPAVPMPGVWRRRNPTKSYAPADGSAAVLRPIRVAVDPVLGRLAFPTGVKPKGVKVSSAFGFSADLGGGPYDRRDSVAAVLQQLKDRPVAWQVGVSQELAPVANTIFRTLAAAIAEWHAECPLHPAGLRGVIAVLDNGTYEEDLTGPNRVEIPEGCELLIVAAGWPEVPVPGVPGAKTRVAGQLVPAGKRPLLIGDIAVVGTAPAVSETPGRFALDGLWIEGGVRVMGGAAANLGGLRIAHCTLRPSDAGLKVLSGNEQLKIELARTICGAVRLPDTVPEFRATESIIDFDGAAGDAIAVPGGAVILEKCTVFGTVAALHLSADNTIFTALVTIERRQSGCVRFCSLPVGSRTPRRFRCQPDLALDGVPAPLQPAVAARLLPSFTSTNYGDPGYAQLGTAAPEEIRTGADDGSEMGAFSFLHQPQRETNLRSSLDEYLRFGLEAGLIFVT